MGPGTIIANRFAIVRILARGGMADVLEALDREDGGRAVAVKVLRDKFMREPEAIARFHREARIVAGFQSSHIARVLAFGTTEKNYPYIAMELLKGNDMSKELHQNAPLPLPDAAMYTVQACRAMIEAHGQGIIHRDLKPSNLFLVDHDSGELRDRILKVLDFGIAKIPESSEEELTNTRSLFGSPLYMSPETFRSAKLADPRSDVWSLGVILYEMLTAGAPFQGDDPLSIGLAVTRSTHVPPTQLRPELPRSIDDVFERVLKKDPDERYGSMRELCDAVEPYATPREDSRSSFRMSVDVLARNSSHPPGRPPDPADGDATLLIRGANDPDDGQPTGPISIPDVEGKSTTLTVLKPRASSSEPPVRASSAPPPARDALESAPRKSSIPPRERTSDGGRVKSEPPPMDSLVTGQVVRPVSLSTTGSEAPPPPIRRRPWIIIAPLALAIGVAGAWIVTLLSAVPATRATTAATATEAETAEPGVAPPTTAIIATATTEPAPSDQPPPLILSATHEEASAEVSSTGSASSSTKRKRTRGPRPKDSGAAPKPPAEKPEKTAEPKLYDPKGI